MVALAYRYRWSVELFFRWLKCVLGARHLIAQNQNGVLLQMYAALIVSLLIVLRTGRKPTKRTFETIQYHLLGWVSDEEFDAPTLPAAKDEMTLFPPEFARPRLPDAQVVIALAPRDPHDRSQISPKSASPDRTIASQNRLANHRAEQNWKGGLGGVDRADTTRPAGGSGDLSARAEHLAMRCPPPLTPPLQGGERRADARWLGERVLSGFSSYLDAFLSLDNGHRLRPLALQEPAGGLEIEFRVDCLDAQEEPVA